MAGIKFRVNIVINDCEIIIAAFIGKKGIERLRERGMKLFFGKGDIQEALNSVFRDEQFYKYYYGYFFTRESY